jgi:hypothetical protein
MRLLEDLKTLSSRVVRGSLLPSIALVTPFAVETFLDGWKNERLLKAFVTVAFLNALSCGALLSAIRGDLLSHQVHESASAVVIDGEAHSTPFQNSFYDSTCGSLRLLMIFLALAIVLGADIAIHRALILGAQPTKTSMHSPGSCRAARSVWRRG